MTSKPFIDIHTHFSKGQQPDSIGIENLYPAELPVASKNNKSLFSLGIHPWHIVPRNLHSDYAILENGVKLKNVVALGETGLDRLSSPPMNTQKEVFEFHLKLASRYNKPIIVHAVRSYPEIVETYKKLKTNPKLIFHGFRGNKQIAEQLIKHGFYLSFGDSLSDPDKKESQLFKTLPLKNIFLETDESNINIEQIYKHAAHIKGITTEEIKDIIFGNFSTCFGDIL